VPHDELTHEQRDRAESFGRVAAEYDRYRPSYPNALIDDLVARRPSHILDIGCGTGKAMRLLVDRGLPVLGVEPDPQMAAVARGHGLEVEVARFEDWDDRGRRFDLIICAQAWHWVDPVIGGPKAAGLLERGGELALFWNFAEVAEPQREIVESVYRRLAPELIRPRGAGDDQAHVRALEESGAFSTVETLTYPADRVWPIDDWLGYESTQSKQLLLGDRLPQVLRELREALDGQPVRTTGGTYLIRARP
jgi:SAM-dependent methyltransferase